MIGKKIIIASLKSENELSKIVSYLEQELQDPFKFGAKGVKVCIEKYNTNFTGQGYSSL